MTGGCGAVCAAKYAGAPLGHFGIATAFGLSVALAVYATRDVSGAHLNPAITASLYVNADCPAEDVGPYCAAQMVGATVGALINYAAYGVSVSHLIHHLLQGKVTVFVHWPHRLPWPVLVGCPVRFARGHAGRDDKRASPALGSPRPNIRA